MSEKFFDRLVGPGLTGTFRNGDQINGEHRQGVEPERVRASDANDRLDRLRQGADLQRVAYDVAPISVKERFLYLFEKIVLVSRSFDDTAENILCLVHVQSSELFQLSSVVQDGLLHRLLLMNLMRQFLLNVNGRNEFMDRLLGMIEKER